MRNQRDLATPNPLRGNVGVNLWVGNYPGASQESFHGMRENPWHNRTERRLMIELGEVEYDRRSRERAFSQLASEPAAFVANSARRFSGFWLAEWWAGYRHIDWYYSLGHVALTGLACAGAWRARRLVRQVRGPRSGGARRRTHVRRAPRSEQVAKMPC